MNEARYKITTFIYIFFQFLLGRNICCYRTFTFSGNYLQRSETRKHSLRCTWYVYINDGGLWCLMLLSTIFQLYHGSKLMIILGKNLLIALRKYIYNCFIYVFTPMLLLLVTCSTYSSVFLKKGVIFVYGNPELNVLLLSEMIQCTNTYM